MVTEYVELIARFELDETPVDNVYESSVMIYVQNGVIRVERAEIDYLVLDAASSSIYAGSEFALLSCVVYVLVGDELENVVL